jgi:putative phosphoesterase
MRRIGLLSDTHGYLDERILFHLSACDEIWHAGDIGTTDVSDALAAIKPYRAVFGNIDGDILRRMHPIEQHFELEGFTVWMTHIAGKPGRYSAGIPGLIRQRKPGILVCGHSHICKVERDASHNLIYMNPGAAGIHGFHKVRTLLRFTLDSGRITDLEVVELGPRAHPAV